MNDFVFYSGLVIVFAATVYLMVFAIRQNRIRSEVKDIPLRFEEWKSNYRVKRAYIAAAQLAGFIIAIIGVMI